MKKIKLNDDMGAVVEQHGYELNPCEEYVINVHEELHSQVAISEAFKAMGAPIALKDYHKWLKDNGFDVNSPNPTNSFVSSYYGKKPLWNTEYSQGIVVKAEDDDDYFIVMECSRLNEGYKYTKVLVTLGGCM